MPTTRNGTATTWWNLFPTSPRDHRSTATVGRWCARSFASPPRAAALGRRSYDTLAGHFEEGRMHYKHWKWLDSGDVEFHPGAVSPGR
jgi:hypothetical protein